MVILNPEGGGTIAGQYNGKHSPEFRHGILNGGNFSRWICNDLQRELDYETIHYTNICPELSNTSEYTRVQRLNSYTMAFDTFAISIYTGTHERSGIRILGNIRERSEEIALKSLVVLLPFKVSNVRKLLVHHRLQQSIQRQESQKL